MICPPTGSESCHLAKISWARVSTAACAVSNVAPANAARSLAVNSAAFSVPTRAVARFTRASRAPSAYSNPSTGTVGEPDIERFPRQRLGFVILAPFSECQREIVERLRRLRGARTDDGATD